MGKSSTSRSRSNQIAQDQKRVVGVNRYMVSMPSVMVGGQGRTPNDLVTLFEGRITKASAVDQKRSELAAAVKADADSRQQTDPVVREFDRIVGGMYAGSPDVLGTFGLTERKPREKNSLRQAAATLKGAQTRAARHPKAAASVPVTLASHVAPVSPAAAPTDAASHEPAGSAPTGTPAATPRTNS